MTSGHSAATNRAAFEAWCPCSTARSDIDPTRYKLAVANDMWAAWKAGQEVCASVCDARAAAIEDQALGARAEQYDEALECAAEIRSGLTP